MTASEPIPHSFGHYEVEQLIGRGGIGTVYLARDRRIGRRVALKTVQLSARQIEDTTALRDFYNRLQREAELSGQLLHPNVVTLYEVGYDEDRVSYLAMEYVEGETLLARMKSGAIPVESALTIIADVLRGLACAHEKGIVHRDVKPANVLLDRDGRAKVADFGIARPQDSSLTGAGSLLGTPNYMSPEQVLGQTLTGRADVFAAGTLLYEMLTGVRPFAAKELTAILHNILRQSPPHVSDVNPAVPRKVGDFVARLMEKDPGRRPDAVEALRELEAKPEEKAEVREQRAEVFVPAAVCLLLSVLAILIAMARIRSMGEPTVTIPATQVAEFAAKRRALDAADALFDAGRFEESLARYEQHLKRYPHSLTAQEGRDRSRDAMEKESKPAPARKSKPSRDEDISPSELLNRLKRVFRR